MPVSQSAGKWEAIPVTVDSGAIDIAGPKEAEKQFGLKETAESKAGRDYQAAN